MWDPWNLALMALVFGLGGFVKGAVGFGLPLIGIGLLAALFGLPTAIALLQVPTVTSNVWQAAVGHDFVPLVRRLWPFLAAAAVTTWAATGFLAGADPDVLIAILGAALVAYVAAFHFGLRFPPFGRNEIWVGPLLGALNGLVAGLTGIFILLTAPYLQTMGLSRDALVQALGIVFVTITIVLAGSLASRAILTWDVALLSAAATVPTFAGLRLGRAFRGRLSEERFRGVFLAALAMLGVYLFVSSLL